MLWIKSFHIIFVVTWFAGIFYLPRLFVYHAMMERSLEPLADKRFQLMERKLYFGIILPSSVLATASGLWLASSVYGFQGGWLHAKISLVMLLWGYQFWCYHLLRRFAAGLNMHSHQWYRWFNEVPVFILFSAVLLVIFRPF